MQHLRPGEYPQGLWSFADFEAYLAGWIKPYMLADLETVFEGTRERWERDEMPQAGRGDFLLATVLFSLFDHLGQFLAGEEDSLSGAENIARVAGALPSVKAVPRIIGQFGRNALTHNAWPQTAFLMDEGGWAFGLNISADPRHVNEHGEPTHNELYPREYLLPTSTGPPGSIKILKLRINVRVLKKELDHFVRNGEFAKGNPRSFTRARNIAIAVSRFAKWDEIKKLQKGKRASAQQIEQEIYALRDKARSLGRWDG